MARMVQGQDRLKELLAVKKFQGVDNLTESDTKLAPGFFRTANNFYIDSEGMLHMREGIQAELISGSWHSIWSDNDHSYGVCDGDLVEIDTVNWVASVLVNGVGNSRMYFITVGLQTFFSNGIVIGYIDSGVAFGFPDVTQEFKAKMVGGKHLEFFNGRLFAVQDRTIFFSDPNAPMVMDMRSNAIPFNASITMLKSVADGMYVSVGEKVVWIGGADPWEKTVNKVRTVLEHPAVEGSAVTFYGDTFPTRKGPMSEGRTVCFSTPKGIFMGLTGGQLLDCTGDHYGVINADEATALTRHIMGYHQYICMSQFRNEITESSISIAEPTGGIGFSASQTPVLHFSDPPDLMRFTVQ